MLSRQLKLADDRLTARMSTPEIQIIDVGNEILEIWEIPAQTFTKTGAQML